MWPYWLMFWVPALLSVSGYGERPRRAVSADQKVTLPWLAAFLTLTILIGCRYEVGGDWPAYVRAVDDAAGTSIRDALTMSDPGYQLLNWASAQLGWGILGVNLPCAAIFSYGLVRFCLSLSRPWLALTVSVPYLVVVVAMGYSRQAVALSLALSGVLYLRSGSMRKFVALVLLGVTFHKTAILLLPLVALGSARPARTMLWLAPVTLGAYVLLLRDSVDDLYVNYIEAQYASEGAFIRLAMNALPAVIFLFGWKRFHFPVRDAIFWRWCAAVSLVLFAALFATGASTAIDRMALYLLPLQMIVFAGLPRGQYGTSFDYLWRGSVVFFYATVHFVWLNFATNAPFWIPYSTAL